MFKRILFITIFFMLLTSVVGATVTTVTRTYKANPINISLSSNSNFVEAYFQVDDLPSSYQVKNAFLEFNITSSSQNGVLKLQNPKDNSILQAISLSSTGTKFYYGLESHFEALRDGDFVKIRLTADGLASSESINIPEIFLKFEFVANDNVQPKIINVEIKETTKDSAIVTWEVNEESKSYFNYGKTSNYDKTAEAVCESLEEKIKCTALLINLSTGTTYHFQIRTEDLAGNSFITGDFTLLTKPDLSSNVLGDNNLTLSQISGLNYKQEDQRIIINWTSSRESNIDGYYIFRQKGSYEFERIAKTDKLANSFVDNDIFPGIEYKYRIRSFRGADISPESETLVVKLDTAASILGANVIQLDRMLLVVFLSSFGVILFFYLFSKKIVINVFNSIFPKKTKSNLFRDPEFYLKEMEEKSSE